MGSRINNGRVLGVSEDCEKEDDQYASDFQDAHNLYFIAKYITILDYGLCLSVLVLRMAAFQMPCLTNCQD